MPLFDRVFIVALENQSFSSVTGGPSMPYFNTLANRYGLAVNYFGNTHPSIGDYFWLTTGQNITNDSNFSGTVTADNIVRQLNAAGKSWKAYAQSIPSTGWTGGDSYPYVKRHNPFAYFSDVLGSQSLANNIVGLGQYTQDLGNNQLPNYSFIIPDQQNNAHDCPAAIPSCTNADKLAAADNFLKTHIDPLIASASFRQGGLLIITFDESVDADTQNGGGHVATVVISSKSKQNFDANTLYQHQSTLRTMAEGLGLTSFPGAAATAPNMSEFFTTTPNTAPDPDVVSPSSGPISGGTSVTIKGTGFGTGATVSFGGTNTSATVVGSTTINAIAPAHSAGSVNVVVTNPGGETGTLNGGFVYAAGAPPSVSGITPNSGPTTGGTSVTINGSAFVSGATVTIGGASATNVNFVNSGTITANTPAHAAGTVNVVVTNPDAQSGTLTNGFTFNAPPGGETVLLADDFNNASLDTSKWSANNLFSGFTDSTVAVSETTTLNVGPLKQNTGGSHYNGIKSSVGYDFVNAYAYVQLVQAPNATTAADAFFTIGFNVDNCYRMYVESGSLIVQTRIGGAKQTLMTLAYNPANHAFWRIRHDAATGLVVFEVAPNTGGAPGTWVQLFSQAWNTAAVPLSSVQFEVKGGTWKAESNSPGTVVFDNFKAAKP
jgi:acid phosphatase